MDEIALIAGACATWYMVGLIWKVQLVHYPLLAEVGPERHLDIARAHTARTAWAVGPAMAIEGLATLWLLGSRPEAVSVGLPWAAAVLLAVALGSTVFVQVPLHSTLTTRHDPQASQQLITTNWVRTLAWSARGGLFAVMLAQAIA